MDELENKLDFSEGGSLITILGRFEYHKHYSESNAEKSREVTQKQSNVTF